MPQDGQATVTVKRDIYDKARKQAEKEHRSISNLFEFVMEKYLEK